MRRFAPVLLAACALAPRPAHAQARWSFELFGGTAHSFRTPLTLRQAGEPDVRVTARYSTRPLADAPYYAYRFARWSGGAGWEAELVHHKVYLENPPPEVQHFEVSHGYNLVTLNRAWLRGATVLRAGAGVVVARPEATIRGTRYEEGGLFGDAYYLSGPTAQGAAGRRFHLAGGLSAEAEGKLTASYARIPIRDGRAVTPNVALHALLGLRYQL